MKWLRRFHDGMVLGAQAYAQWDISTSRRILGDRRRLLALVLLLLPVALGGWAFAGEIGEALPALLGGKQAYGPAHYTTTIFLASTAVGVVAGLITGCIGAGGGFIIA